MSEVVTVGGVPEILYGTRAGAKAYHAGNSAGSSWAALAADAQRNALITATRLLERQAWAGAPTEPVDKSDYSSQPAGTQPLQFPRTGLSDANGVAVSSTSIPYQVDYATYELALVLSADPATVQGQQVATSLVKEHRLLERVEGAVTVDETNKYLTADQAGIVPGRFPQAVMELIGLWLAGGAGAADQSPEIGDNGSSSFIECQDLGYFDLGLP